MLVQRQRLVGAQDVMVSSGSVSVLLLDSIDGIKWRHEAPKRQRTHGMFHRASW